ncbi:MAG: hypothetical protein IRZ16_13440 [Myxococcaceae bacterium]|nr:hypothetical protein [Myxococcaceae bacterium]
MKALLGLFETDLADLKFPDIDATVLADAARRVLSAADRVAEAKAALEAAESALQVEQEGLLQKGQRALAYARVFAEESPALMEKLQLIALPRSSRRASRQEPSTGGAEVVPVRRRGRPPKVKAEAPNLFEEAVARAQSA